MPADRFVYVPPESEIGVYTIGVKQTLGDTSGAVSSVFVANVRYEYPVKENVLNGPYSGHS